MDKGDWIFAGVVFTIVGGIIALLASIPISKSDNYELTNYGSPGSVEFQLVEASSQKMRGEAHMSGQGGGSFLAWGSSMEGSANFGSGQGRLAVKTTLEGQEKFFDIQITRSEYLSLRNNNSETITLDVVYEPCEVPELGRNLVCYRLMDQGRYMSTSQDFRAEETIIKADIDDKNPWYEGHGADKMYNGYFSDELSANIIYDAAQRLGQE